MRRTSVRLVAHLSSITAVRASFPQKVTALTAAGEPDIARSARRCVEARTACSKALGRVQAQHIRRPTRAHPLHIRSTLLHFTCARDATHSSAACAWSSSRRSRSCRQSTETVGRYRLPTASAMPRAQTTRVRSGSIACVTAVHRGAYWRRRSRSERSESHLRSRDRRTGDQGHRGRCPADQSRPWGRMRGARGAIDQRVCIKRTIR